MHCSAGKVTKHDRKDEAKEERRRVHIYLSAACGPTCIVKVGQALPPDDRRESLLSRSSQGVIDQQYYHSADYSHQQAVKI
jgi:hypothetical protein